MPMLRKNPEIIRTTVTETVLQTIQHAESESARKGSRGRPVMVSLAGPGPPPAEMHDQPARSAPVALGAGDPMRVGGRGWPAKLEIMEVMSLFRTTQHADESK